MVREVGCGVVCMEHVCERCGAVRVQASERSVVGVVFSLFGRAPNKTLLTSRVWILPTTHRICGVVWGGVMQYDADRKSDRAGTFLFFSICSRVIPLEEREAWV